MRILLLGFNRKETNYEINRLTKELKKRGHGVNYVYWKGLVFSFSEKGVSIKKARDGRDLKYYDYIIPRSPLNRSPQTKKGGERVYLSHLYRHYLLIVDYINKYYKHILNEKTAKRMPFYDKLFQHYLLAKNNLPVITSLLYTGRQLPDSVYKKYKTPYIVKSIEGSQGKQIFLINSKDEAGRLIEEFGLGKVMVQKYIPTNQDYRIIVIGNKVIGGMQRTAPEGEFRTNVASGAYTEKIKLSKELKDLAKKAAKIFNAEFAGVDVLKYKGKYYIVEVNIFPMFEGFEAATKINVAEELVRYIERKYLWSIDTPSSSKTKMDMFEELYKIEKENLEKSLNKKDFQKELKEKEIIIIKKENKPIAYLTHYSEKNTRYISRLVILPKYIGQRIGRRMLRHLTKIAKKEGNKKIEAVVPSTNQRRQKSFKRAHFEKVKTLPEHFKNGADGIVFRYSISEKKKVKGPELTESGGMKKGKK